MTVPVTGLINGCLGKRKECEIPEEALYRRFATFRH